MNLTEQDRTILQGELAAYARHIEEFWKTQMDADDGLTKGELFVRYPDLGSDSRFGKFLRGNFDDTTTTLADWHHDYRTVWNLIEDLGARQKSQGGPNILNTLSGITAARKALLKLTGINSSRRVLHITGESGLGKTCIATSLQSRWGSRVVIVEATNIWADKPNRLLGALCEAVGMKPAGLPAAAADKKTLLTGHLRATRTCLVIEEAHHLGPAMIDTIKTLVNDTPGEFVFISIPTLMKRLQMAAYEQARQLFASHRLFRTIKLTLTQNDAVLMLQDRLGMFPDIKAVAAWLCEATRAPRHGNLGFIRDAADEVLATREAAAATADITAAEVQRAALRVIEER